MKNLMAGLKSPQTTVAAILAAIVAILNVVIALLDGDPETVPDWNIVAVALITLWGFINARDADKTSEESNGV